MFITKSIVKNYKNITLGNTKKGKLLLFEKTKHQGMVIIIMTYIIATYLIISILLLFLIKALLNSSGKKGTLK